MPEMQVVSSERREFDVWNEVPLVPQLTGMSCWAAAAAMIIGWRDVICVEPEQVAQGAGRWSEYREGLHPMDLEDFARAWGLTSETQLEWSVEEVRALLERYGPVWLGEASPGLHSIVVTGMYGDGSANGTFVRINDPWPINRGERYTLPWRQLMANFRNATTIAGVHAQVMHATGRRGGPSGSYHFTQQHVTRSYVNRNHQSKDVAMHHTNGQRRHYEEYPASYGSAVAYATAVSAGQAYINTQSSSPDPLAGQGGTGENLCLLWNELPDDVNAIDVVVHLHGYSSAAPNAALLRAKVAAAGLDLARRQRPTLAIVPRGRKITDAEIRANPRANAQRYTFPALVADHGGGLERLVAFALDHFKRNVLHATSGAPLRIDRLIFTAHSGGGAPLNQLLAAHATRAVCNPHEVHVFDAFYGEVRGVIAWAQARLAADRALPPGAVAAQGGALRVAYGSGTAAGSRAVSHVLPNASDPLRAAYRAELTPIGHGEIPRAVGPVLLADARADLPARTGARTGGSDDTYGAPVGLLEYYRNNPPDEYESSYAPPDESGAIALQTVPAWCPMRNVAATVARAEERRWTQANGTKYLENNPAMLQALRDYWGAVPGVNAVNAANQSAANAVAFPWSAAFICYVMRQAGFTTALGFNFGSAHMRYIVGALRNRERSDQNKPFWLVDSIEVQNEALPEPGDLICLNRRVQVNGQWQWTNHSFDSLRQQFWSNGHENVPPSGSSHTALVVGTWQDPATGDRFLETIGGNEDQSVRLRRNIRLNQHGGIANPAANRIFGMIKIIGC